MIKRKLDPRIPATCRAITEYIDTYNPLGVSEEMLSEELNQEPHIVEVALIILSTSRYGVLDKYDEGIYVKSIKK